MRIRQIRTSIPRWYTAGFLEKRRKRCCGVGCAKCSPEPGATIRSKVPVSAKGIIQQLRDEETRLTSLFGTEVYYRVVPFLQTSESLEVKITGQTDEEQVEAYVSSTYQEASRFDPAELVGYLVDLLSKTPATSRYKHLRLLSVRARDTLSYAKLEFKYTKLGLVLLRGENRDWAGGHSNGSGKTNLLSTLTVALYGQTLKGQKDNAWAREKGSKSQAWVRLRFKDERNRTIEIVRARPHAIYVYVDGVDQSAGLSGKRKQETQGVIEELAGFDMRMLQNAVYIDQSLTNDFVFGTNKDRMDSLNRFLDLERYAEVQLQASKDLVKARLTLAATITQEEKLTGKLEELRELLTLEPEESGTKWAEKEKVLRTQLAQHVKRGAELADLQQFHEELEETVDASSAELDLITADLHVLMGEEHGLKAQRQEAQSLVDAENCPTCGQPAQDVGLHELKRLRKEHSGIRVQAERLAKARESKERIKAKNKGRLDSYKAEVGAIAYKISSIREQLESVLQAAQEEKKRNVEIAARRDTLLQKINTEKKALKACRKALAATDIRVEMLSDASKALSRNGLPLYLAAGLCPVLNTAAEEYAEIFSQGRIKLFFQVVDKEFRVEVVNTAGSEHLTGQSVGEAALAGIICAFALRDTAPKTNVLILDEPGHGLDPSSAKAFAQGLLEIKHRYESVIVVTHNPVIEAQLAGARQWVVRKRNGVSTLIQ